jgi:hypothetical protein
MNGVHDMGGMHGFGPILREVNEPLFHADWEARLWAIDRILLQQGYFTIDAHRYGIERMAPVDYLRASYYERWLASFEYNLIHEGLIAADELGARIEFLRRHPNSPLRQDVIPAPPAPREHPKSVFQNPLEAGGASISACRNRLRHARSDPSLVRWAAMAGRF